VAGYPETVVVIGGSAGIGFETAKRARAEGPTSS
jgi:NAD(P)-dependent dehydrogenase (short-subunit alcohol dehydrogenase family)